MRNRNGYDPAVRSPVLICFTKKQMEGIDLAVEEGVASSRAGVICNAVDMYLDHLQDFRDAEAARAALAPVRQLTQEEQDWIRETYRKGAAAVTEAGLEWRSGEELPPGGHAERLVRAADRWAAKRDSQASRQSG